MVTAAGATHWNLSAINVNSSRLVIHNETALDDSSTSWWCWGPRLILSAHNVRTANHLITVVARVRACGSFSSAFPMPNVVNQ